MTTHKHIDRICCAVLALVLILTLVFVNAESFGVQAVSAGIGYEGRLFDTTTVHTIDIVMDDWDSFIETCENEEYEDCSLLIDNEAYKNVGIRAKGNTSLSSVSAYGNDRYSFKLEFDCYDKTKSYYGLDKISLNNIIQDNTYLKDYLCYQMMGYFGVDAPLCSFVYITVNGEDWGLYLAVEGVEESFLERNYGNDYGELYKPDSSSMGGGRGNGGDFDFDKIKEKFNTDGESENTDKGTGKTASVKDGMDDVDDMEDVNGIDSIDDMNGIDGMGDVNGIDGMSDVNGIDGMSDMNGMDNMDNMKADIDGMKGGMGGMSMGGDDVSLIYSDDEYDSYSSIFDNAKTDITDADKDRLIASLKKLNDYEDIEDVVNVEEVIRYFVVHNFVCNFDSYTGSIIHNYYLYEKDGQMSMIPWDYNLAFGGFQGMSDADSLVNYPIDTPVSGGTVESRPMLAWIFSDEEYTQLYHQYLSEFISEYFDSGYFAEMIDSVSDMIAPYVEKDPTKFCTYEEFEQGVSTLREFCLLRAESVSGQLDGTIPSTSDGQSTDSSALIDASALTISDMGSMGNKGGPGGKDQDFGNFAPGNAKSSDDSTETDNNEAETNKAKTSGTKISDAQISGTENTDTSAQQNAIPAAAVQSSKVSDNTDAQTSSSSETTSNTAEESATSTDSEAAPADYGTASTDTKTAPADYGTTSADSNAASTTQQTPDPGTMQIPDNPGGGFPGDMNRTGDAPGSMSEPNSSETQAPDQSTILVLLAISAASLAMGLIFAFKFKR